jgi:hypothetical protein
MLKSAVHTMLFHFPVYVAIPCYLFVILLAITFSCILLARWDTPSDPFSDFSYIFRSGDAALVEHGFSCRIGDFLNTGAAAAGQGWEHTECSYNPDTGNFSRITINYMRSNAPEANDEYTTITFRIREGKITIGVLVLLCGKPSVHSINTDRFVSLAWSECGMTTSIVRLSSRRLDYFLPVVSVTFKI